MTTAPGAYQSFTNNLKVTMANKCRWKRKYTEQNYQLEYVWNFNLEQNNISANIKGCSK